MTAIDIGANLGVYSLPMARLVGPGGRVFAYEPGGEARALLEQSRDANGFGNLEVLGLALSDGEREGHLGFADSSELRALGGGGGGEPVRITSLDLESAARGWPAVDFIKIDAEGEEERIVAGGQGFLRAPFAAGDVRDQVRQQRCTSACARSIRRWATRLYRQLGGAPLLVPADLSKPLDGYELNLFAAKPDRAQELAQRGLLVETVPDWRPGPADLDRAVSFWRRQPFASLVTLPEGGGLSADEDYQNALVGYAVWRAAEQPAAIRCAALAFALQSARVACARGATAERASTWARIAWEWGARSESVTALQRLLQLLQGLQVARAVLAGGRALRRHRRRRPAVGVVRRRRRRAVRADLQFLVGVRRRIALARLAVRTAVRERGNGAPARARGGGRGISGHACRNGCASRRRIISMRRSGGPGRFPARWL